MKLSERVWNSSTFIIEAIKNHPFNQELMQGTLELDKFAYYIEQDSLYLQDFARCHAIIAAKTPINYVRQFLHFSDYTLVTEHEIVHTFFKQIFNFRETGLLAPATLSYTSYLLRVCAHEPVEVAIAAVLPCFWVYAAVGEYIAAHTVADNPYARWIETYSSDDFLQSVQQMLEIFDTFAESASPIVQQKMADAFYKSSCLEWHFWNDAYYQRVFDVLEERTEGRIGEMICAVL